jgi:hypothetical protein
VLWARPYLYVLIPVNCQVVQVFFFFVCLGAEILLCRREGKKFWNYTDPDLQALCLSFDKGVGLCGFGNVLANIASYY